MSEDFVDATIANLKVIGMVPKNGRLCVRKGQICLDHTDSMQGLRRWMRGDSRDLAIMHVRNTINNAVRIISHLTVSSSAAAIPLSWTVQRILGEMQSCEIGLQNLRTTYADDSLMVANINVLIERIAEIRLTHSSHAKHAKRPKVLETSSSDDDHKANEVISSASFEEFRLDSVKESSGHPSSTLNTPDPPDLKHLKHLKPDQKPQEDQKPDQKPQEDQKPPEDMKHPVLKPPSVSVNDHVAQKTAENSSMTSMTSAQEPLTQLHPQPQLHPQRRSKN